MQGATHANPTPYILIENRLQCIGCVWEKFSKPIQVEIMVFVSDTVMGMEAVIGRPQKPSRAFWRWNMRYKTAATVDGVRGQWRFGGLCHQSPRDLTSDGIKWRRSNVCVLPHNSRAKIRASRSCRQHHIFCARKVNTRTKHLPRLGVAFQFECIHNLIAHNFYVWVIKQGTRQRRRLYPSRIWMPSCICIRNRPSARISHHTTE